MKWRRIEGRIKEKNEAIGKVGDLQCISDYFMRF